MTTGSVRFDLEDCDVEENDVRAAGDGRVDRFDVLACGEVQGPRDGHGGSGIAAGGEGNPAKAKELFPGKPVTEVAVTHFHDDHAGAAKGFLEEGITLITTPCNVNYFKTVGNYNSTTTR